jgi:hypothetical protein
VSRAIIRTTLGFCDRESELKIFSSPVRFFRGFNTSALAQGIGPGIASFRIEAVFAKETTLPKKHLYRVLLNEPHNNYCLITAIRYVTDGDKGNEGLYRWMIVPLQLF